MYIGRLTKIVHFWPKLHVLTQNANFYETKKFLVAYNVMPTECVNLKNHTPLYLNVYGQANQQSQMASRPATLGPPASLTFLKSGTRTENCQIVYIAEYVNLSYQVPSS